MELYKCLISEGEMALILAERLRNGRHTEFSISVINSMLTELIEPKFRPVSVFLPPVIDELLKRKLIRLAPGVTSISYSYSSNNSKQFELA